MQCGHGPIGDDDRTFLQQFRRQQRAGPSQQVVADHHVVAGAGQYHVQPPGRLPLHQRVHHAGCGVVRVLLAAIHDHVGLGVDGMALFHEPAQRLLPSTPFSRGRLSRVATRRSSVGRVQRSQTVTASARVASRVRSSMKAPPPKASTIGSPASRRRITRRSPSRNAGSPYRPNNSGMEQPAASSISWSASRNGKPRRRGQPAAD